MVAPRLPRITAAPSERAALRELTEDMLRTLRTDITVTNANTPWAGSTLGQLWIDQDDFVVAAYYNEKPVPAVPIWNPRMLRDDILDGIRASEYAALAVGVQNTWMIIVLQEQFDATKELTRDNFNFIFPDSTCPTTNANIMALARLDGTHGEILYADPTPVQGAQISPACGYIFSADTISDARSVPAA